MLTHVHAEILMPSRAVLLARHVGRLHVVLEQVPWFLLVVALSLHTVKRLTCLESTNTTLLVNLPDSCPAVGGCFLGFWDLPLKELCSR